MPLAVTSIKELLHQAIESCEDEKLIQAVYTILSSKQGEKDLEIEENPEQLQLLKEREENYFSGAQASYSLEDFKIKFSGEHGL